MNTFLFLFFLFFLAPPPVFPRTINTKTSMENQNLLSFWCSDRRVLNLHKRGEKVQQILQDASICTAFIRENTLQWNYYMSYMHATSIGLKWRNEKKRRGDKYASTHCQDWNSCTLYKMEPTETTASAAAQTKSNCRWNLLIFHRRHRSSVRRNLVSPACSSQKERYPVNSQAKKGTSSVIQTHKQRKKDMWH